MWHVGAELWEETLRFRGCWGLGNLSWYQEVQANSELVEGAKGE